MSQIESAKVLPSLETLYRLATAFGVPVAEFIPSSDGKQSATVVRASHRERIGLNDGIIWESLVPAGEVSIPLILASYPPGAIASTSYLQHEGRDFYFLIEGELTIELAFETHLLNVGDSIVFEGAVPHRLSNRGPSFARAVTIILEPSQHVRDDQWSSSAHEYSGNTDTPARIQESSMDRATTTRPAGLSSR